MPTPSERNKAAGNLVSAALLALDQGLRPTHPELFSEVSMLLHDALNEMTKLMFDLIELDERPNPEEPE